MSVTINGDTGIDKVQDGSIVAADLASTLDLSGKTITLATDAVDQLSTATGSAPSYSARAWVTFLGNINPISILASGNVSSITDVGVGQYIMNFTTAMPDANFCTQFMAQPTVSNAGADTFAINPNTTQVAIRHFEANVNRDGNYCCAVVFR